MHENGVHDVKSYYLKSNNFNTEEQPAIVPEKGSKDSLADGQPDGFYVTVGRTAAGLYEGSEQATRKAFFSHHSVALRK